MRLGAQLQKQFSESVPLLVHDKESIKLELKPYLQPFERELASRELRSLVGARSVIEEQYGYVVVRTKIPERHLIERLAFWQRLGRDQLIPTIQAALEYTQGAVSGETLHSSRRLRYGPHDLHEYRGKFFPQLVRSLINISQISARGVVLDPMAGSGTTPCEALASGHSAIAVDLNPLSVLISRVKSEVTLQSPDKFRASIQKYLDRFSPSKTVRPDSVWPAADLEYLLRWFSPAALADLAAILQFIKSVKAPFYRDFLMVCLSNVIRPISWQKEVDLRVRKEVKQYKSGTAHEKFRNEVQDQLERIYPYLEVLPSRPAMLSCEIINGDATNIHRALSRHKKQIDLIVTSPPYATALPYLDTDRLSLIVLGLLERREHRQVELNMIGTREVSERERVLWWEQFQQRKKELPNSISTLIEEIADHNHQEGVGFRRRNLPALLGRYFLAMRDAMSSAKVLMKSGSRAFYVVGNNSTVVSGEKLEIPTDEFLFEVGASVGWKQDERISMELLASRDIFRENRGSAESILCFTAK